MLQALCSSMNKVQWFWLSVSLPLAGVGIVAFFGSIYVMYMAQGGLLQKLNNLGVFGCVFLAFGSMSMATLLAAKGRYLQSKIIGVIHQTYLNISPI